MSEDVVDALTRYRPGDRHEAADVERLLALARAGDPWSRALPLHVTGSALVVHPPTRRVLLRWHERMQRWLQVGGHGDPGEASPLAVALREGREETGLADLVPWPDVEAPVPVHVVVVPVPAGKGEPDHLHGDVRYVLATTDPDAAVPEDEGSPLRWLDIDEAIGAVEEDNVRTALVRVAALLA